jgi:hypothetical protein
VHPADRIDPEHVTEVHCGYCKAVMVRGCLSRPESERCQSCSFRDNNCKRNPLLVEFVAGMCRDCEKERIGPERGFNARNIRRLRQ